MSRSGRVLIVDDLERWRTQLSTILRRAGFFVDTASTVSEALERISAQLYHVLVLDIRMVDPDESNIEGMSLLATLEELGLLDAVSIVMLSAYGTPEQMRTAFRQYRVADFQSKNKFSGRELVDSIKRVFIKDVLINLDLMIQWQAPASPQQILPNMLVGQERIKRDSELYARAQLELDDLLCRLFHKADSVLVKTMVSGGSGAAVIWVQPFYASGSGNPVVVKFGDFRLIDQEYRNYSDYVKPFVGGGRRTSVEDLRRTPLLGGIVYSLLGGAGESFLSFGEFYDCASDQEINRVLDRLFYETCGNWYSGRSQLQPLNLTEEYEATLGLSIAQLRKAFTERLDSVHGQDQLVFDRLSANRTFLNPIEALAGQQLLWATSTTVTHGDLNASNILVDGDHHVWMIDFLRTQRGHILRDVAELEAAIRLQLLGEHTATLQECLVMEETLAECTRFSQVSNLAHEFPTENEALAKAYRASVHLRTIAARLVATGGNDAMDDYFIALLYYALNLVRFYQLPKIKREHALISASILAERLGMEIKHE